MIELFPKENFDAMTKKKSNMLPKMEILIMVVFFLSFFGWAIQRCSQSGAEYEEAVEENASAETSAAITPAKDSLVKRRKPEVIREQYTPLYVTIDNLNMRDQPSLKGKIVDRLKLFDELTFMNEVTDFSEEINLGEEVVNEPWVKVKTSKGRSGWVFGGGVHYYKTKRKPKTVKPVEESTNE